MVQKVKNILDQALALPPNSRAYIAEVLLESLDFEQDFPVGKAWKAEIDKRCREIDQGEVELISGDEALASLLERSG
jgi:putative addiction module component (TIGR02574 family)